jgi:hypothetical protein
MWLEATLLFYSFFLFPATDAMVTDEPLQRPEVLFPVSRDSLIDSNRRLSGIPATFVST